MASEKFRQKPLIQYVNGKPVGHVPTEEEEQIALFDWAHAVTAKYPMLKYLKADANGGLRPSKVRYDKSGRAHRFSVEAQKLRRAGLKPGFPDISLHWPVIDKSNIPKYGLFIELKRTEGGSLSDEQKDWLGYLNSAGYVAVACKGFEAARHTILRYLAGESLTMKGLCSIVPKD
jgi:hypothetical protein